MVNLNSIFNLQVLKCNNNYNNFMIIKNKNAKKMFKFKTKLDINF